MKKLPSKPEFGEVVAMRLALAKESDRGSALVALAFIEDSLSHSIRARLPGDDDSLNGLFAGPIHSLDPKLKLALALRAIDHGLADEIQRLAAIRNRFGHLRQPLQFEEPSVASMCDSLHFAQALQRKGLPRVSSRALFEGAASLITFLLLDRGGKDLPFDQEKYLDTATKTMGIIEALQREGKLPPAP